MLNISPQQLRRRYSDEALLCLPRILLMIDRNPYSPTYGCFDRSFWHYKVSDFPCGMSQEFVLPLAMAYTFPYEDNPYFQKSRIKEFALQGIRYAAQSSHRDGTCDDYFPNERAMGALVFSLNAFCESLLYLNEKPTDLLEFISKRATYLLKHNESGRLSNHQALAALALYNTWLLTNDDTFLKGTEHFVSIVEKWQSKEGWFQEYEGADPGYQSCTISFLGRLFKKNQDEHLLKLLNPAVDFSWYFMHPDGSYAGEYGSRNTYHFYPYGFEVMAPYNQRAAQIADHFLKVSLPNRTRYFNDDDRMCAHYVYDWLQSYNDFSPIRSTESILDAKPYSKWFEEAKLFIKRNENYHAILNLSKGGVLKVFSKAGPLYSDTGPILLTDKNQVLVSHIVSPENQISVDLDANMCAVSGRFCIRKAKYSSPFKQILFRILNITMGAFNENLLRSILQKFLITGKNFTSVCFDRHFRFLHDSIIVDTRVTDNANSCKLVKSHLSTDATSIYVANSNVYSTSMLLPWIPLEKFPENFNKSATAEYTVLITMTNFHINEK